MVLHFLVCSYSFCCQLGFTINIQSGKLRWKNPGHGPFTLFRLLPGRARGIPREHYTVTLSQNWRKALIKHPDQFENNWTSTNHQIGDTLGLIIYWRPTQWANPEYFRESTIPCWVLLNPQSVGFPLCWFLLPCGLGPPQMSLQHCWGRYAAGLRFIFKFHYGRGNRVAAKVHVLKA